MPKTLYTLIEKRKPFIIEFISPRVGLSKRYEVVFDFFKHDIRSDKLVIFYDKHWREVRIGIIKRQKSFTTQFIVELVRRSPALGTSITLYTLEIEDIYGMLREIPQNFTNNENLL